MVPISIETNLYFSPFPYFRVFEKYFTRGKPVKKQSHSSLLRTTPMLRIQALHPKIHRHDTTDKLRSGDLTYNEASNSPEPTLEAIPCSLLHFHELCGTSPPQIYILPQPTCTFVITIRIAASKFGRSTFSIGRMRSYRRQIGVVEVVEEVGLLSLQPVIFEALIFGQRRSVGSQNGSPFLVYTCAVL